MTAGDNHLPEKKLWYTADKLIAASKLEPSVFFISGPDISLAYGVLADVRESVLS